ncbi:hypothetical protein PQX77_020767 [Marasmius sp. AFHP31]|nr:hypothetical protein PQX77_020767 [Marasmius sp. AFHP31]
MTDVEERLHTSRWNSDEARQHLLNAEHIVSHRVMGIWSGFVKFALRDNVMEVAVSSIYVQAASSELKVELTQICRISSQFTAVVNSLVSNILLPPISLLPFMSKNIEEKSLILSKGPHGNEGYNTRQQALDDGAVIMAYGQLIDKLLNFIIVGLTIYLITISYGYLINDSIIEHKIYCSYCRKQISAKAERTPECTTWMDGREDKETSVINPPHRYDKD